MITFQNVTKTFGDGSVGVADLTLTIPQGSCTFITGPSGSGKTTLLRLLTQEYLPTEGEIVFDGTPLSSIKKRHRYKHRRRIGVVYQDYRLIRTKNVWENVALPLQIARYKKSEINQKVNQLLQSVELADQANYFPQQLSGGEAQRVAIARALATNPEVVCADEPTGNLDPQTSLSIAKLLLELAQEGTTLLFITHDQGVLAKYKQERILKLENGSLKKDSDPVKIDQEAIEAIQEDLDEGPVKEAVPSKIEAKIESLDDDDDDSLAAKSTPKKPSTKKKPKKITATKKSSETKSSNGSASTKNDRKKKKTPKKKKVTVKKA